ncbi:MAG: glycosyltransferase family 4 protein [bacterium]
MAQDKVTIAHIVTTLELGGAQENTLYTVGHLNKDKYRVVLIHGPEGILENINKIPPPNQEEHKIGSPFIKHKIDSLIRHINPIKDWKAYRKLKCLFEEENVDIVHTHSSKAGILGRWAAKFAGVPVIIHTFHGFGFHDYQNFLVKKFFIFLEKITARITDKLIAVSEDNIKKGLSYGIGKREQYRLIHSGIQIEKFLDKNIDAQKKKKELGLDINSHIVGMIACFKPQKAPLDFIKMAEIVSTKLEDVQFVLVGDGVLRPEIERAVNERNLKNKVILTGWRTDIPQIMHTFDVFALTSLWEGLPRVIPEAFVSSKPVVATAVDGSKDIVRDGENGYLVSARDMETMAQRVVFLLINKQKAQEMGKEGRELILNSSFNIDGMVKDLEKLYRGYGSKIGERH